MNTLLKTLAYSGCGIILMSQHLQAEQMMQQQSQTSPLKAALIGHKPNWHRLVLRFPSSHIQLIPSEKSRLERLLDQTIVDNPSYKAYITAGPVSSEQNTVIQQTAKLRSHAVARVVYPYAHNIQLSYSADLQPDLVVVEFRLPAE